MPRPRLFAGLVVVLTGCTILTSQPGTPYQAGFRVVALVDSTRPFQLTGGGSVPRPLHLQVWYPSIKGSGERLELGDYLMSTGHADPLGPPDEAEYRRRLEASRDTVLSPSATERHLRRSAQARAGARPAPGRFPVLLLEGGLDSPAYLFTELAERVAALGVVVAVLPSFGPAEGERLRYDSAGVMTQAGDIRLAVTAVRRLVVADSDRVVIGGWGTGSLSAAVAARAYRGPPLPVRAVVSLDGALGYAYGVDLARSLSLDPHCFDLPLAHFSGTRPARARVPKSRGWFEQLPGPQDYWITVTGLSHPDFTSLFGTRAPWFLQRSDRSSVQEASELLARLVSEFVERATGDESAAWEAEAWRQPIETLYPAEGGACPSR